MHKKLPLLILLAACTTGSDPMPWLTDAQRACLAQVEAALPLEPGQAATLLVDRSGAFSGAVTENGFVVYDLDSAPYDGCIGQAAEAQALAGMAEVAPGVFLNAADKAIWDTLTPAQRERALAFIANGGTLQSSLGKDLTQ